MKKIITVVLSALLSLVVFASCSGDNGKIGNGSNGTVNDNNKATENVTSSATSPSDNDTAYEGTNTANDHDDDDGNNPVGDVVDGAGDIVSDAGETVSDVAEGAGDMVSDGARAIDDAVDGNDNNSNDSNY